MTLGRILHYKACTPTKESPLVSESGERRGPWEISATPHWPHLLPLQAHSKILSFLKGRGEEIALGEGCGVYAGVGD